MKPVLFNSLDVSAPQLTSSIGSLINVIKKCLVTGYGEKSGLGWEVLYDGANKLAIRSSNLFSSRSILLIDDNNDSYSNVTGYKNWDDVNNTGIDSFGTGFFVKNWSTTTPNWVLLGVDDVFYIFIQSEPTSSVMRAMSGFGDMQNYYDSTKNCVLFASSGTTYNQENTGHEKDIPTSNGYNIKLPSSAFVKSSSSIKYGDRGDTDTNTTHVAFCDCVGLANINGSVYEPVFKIKGLLYPFSYTLFFTVVNNVDSIESQNGFIEPVLGFYQPWHGRLWFKMDDWG